MSGVGIGDINVRITASQDGVSSATQTAVDGLNAMGAAADSASARFSTLSANINASVGLTETKIKSATQSAQVFGETLAGQSALAASSMSGVVSGAEREAAAITNTTRAVGRGTAAYEAMVLVHEAIQGRFSRMAGSALIFTQLLGVASLATIGMVTAGALLTAGLVYMEYESLKAQKVMSDLAEGFALTGRGASITAGSVQYYLRFLGELPGSNEAAATSFVKLASQHASWTKELINSTGQLLPAFIDAYGKEAPKALATLTDSLADLTESGFKKLDRELLNLSPQQYETIQELIKTGQTAQAVSLILQQLSKQSGTYMKSLGDQVYDIEHAIKETKDIIDASGMAGSLEAETAAMSKLADLEQRLAAVRKDEQNQSNQATANSYKNDLDAAEQLNVKLNERGEILSRITTLTKDAEAAQATGDKRGLATFSATLSEEQAKLTEFDSRAKDASYRNFEAMEEAKSQAARAGSSQRIAIAQAEVNKAGATFGQESTQYYQALAKLNEAKREAAQQGEKIVRDEESIESQIRRNSIAADIEINKERLQAKREELQAEVTAGTISRAEELAEDRSLLAEEFELDKQAVENAASAHNIGKVEYAKYMDQLRELKAKFVSDSAALDRQEATAQKAELNTQVSSYRYAMNELMGFEDTFVHGVLSGRQTMGQALLSATSELVQKEIEADLKYLTQKLLFSNEELAADKSAATGGFIVHEIMESQKTAASGAGATARIGIQSSEAAAGKAISAASAGSAILIDAKQAAAGAYAAVSQIPIIGPILAPIAAATAFGAVAAYGAVTSAEGGAWEVPGGLFMLHPEESVLPAAVANPMRDFFSGGAGGGAGDQYHISIYAADAASVRNLFMANGSALVQSLAAQQRNANSKLMGMTSQP